MSTDGSLTDSAADLDEQTETATSLKSTSSATKSEDEYTIEISVDGIVDEIVSMSMMTTESNTKQTETPLRKLRRVSRTSRKSRDESRAAGSSKMLTTSSELPRSSPDRAPAVSLKTLAKLANLSTDKEKNVVERQPLLVSPEPPDKYEPDNADFHMLSVSSDVSCPTCGSCGPFVSNVYLTKDRQCFSSCLTTFCKHFCCCSIPKQDWKCVIKCPRCHNQIMVFNTEEEWLVFK